MKAPKSQRLVIDTTVICAASEKQTSRSSACRNFLLDICTICHKAVMTDDIRFEWNKHFSGFSRKWRVMMRDLKKSPEWVTPMRVDIDTSGLSDKDFEAVEKDKFLIEAAISSDSVIITLDDTFLKALAKTPQGSELIRSIRWINPVTDGCDALLDL